MYVYLPYNREKDYIGCIRLLSYAWRWLHNSSGTCLYTCCMNDCCCKLICVPGFKGPMCWLEEAPDSMCACQLSGIYTLHVLTDINFWYLYKRVVMWTETLVEMLFWQCSWLLVNYDTWTMSCAEYNKYVCRYTLCTCICMSYISVMALCVCVLLIQMPHILHILSSEDWLPWIAMQFIKSRPPTCPCVACIHMYMCTCYVELSIRCNVNSP